MHTKQKKNTGFILACLSGALYGTLGLFGANLMKEGMSISQMSFIRFLTSIVMLLPIIFLAREKIKLNKNALYTMMASGMFYTTATTFYFLSIEKIGTGLAMVLYFLYPLPVAILEYAIDGVKQTRVYKTAVFIVLVGIIFLTNFSINMNNIAGIGYGVICATLFAFYFYITQKHVKHLPLWTGTFWVCIGNLIGFTASVIAYDRGLPDLNYTMTFDILGISLLATVLPIYMVYRSMNYISPSVASLLSVFEPVVTIILGVLFLQESLGIYQIIGVIIILSGVLYLNIKEE
jgi:drug/metabolite transporter (DMT)-like permease